MYGVDLSVQIKNIMPAAGLGFVLGFICDALSLIRLSYPKRKALVFAVDFLFVVLCCVSSFTLYLAVNYGRMRLYLLAAEAVGFVAYRCSMGILIGFFIRKISSAVVRFNRALFSKIKRISDKIRRIKQKLVLIEKKRKAKANENTKSKNRGNKDADAVTESEFDCSARDAREKSGKIRDEKHEKNKKKFQKLLKHGNKVLYNKRDNIK